MPHGDEKIDLLRSDDIALFDPKTLAELSVGLAIWRIIKSADCIQAIARKFVTLSSYDDRNKVDLGLYLYLCWSDSRDYQ